MKKNLIIFLFAMLCLNLIKSNAFQLENEVINTYQMYGITSYDNDVVLFGLRNGVPAIDF